MLSRQLVKEHLRARKEISELNFTQGAKPGDSPEFMKLRSKRVSQTGLVDAGGDYRILMEWKAADIREKRSFSAWLFINLAHGLEPVARMDYHGSHGDLHVHLNCEIDRNMVNRALPGAKVLQMRPIGRLDPALSLDRNRLINSALLLFNVEFSVPEGGLL